MSVSPVLTDGRAQNDAICKRSALTPREPEIVNVSAVLTWLLITTPPPTPPVY